MANEGKIYRKAVPFTQVANSALRDPSISLKAKGLYALIQSYITIPDFVLYKDFLMKQCKEGRDAFNKTFSELRQSGYLVQYKRKNDNGTFYYEYELLDVPLKIDDEKPDTEGPHTDFQYMDLPYPEYQSSDFQQQVSLNTESTGTNNIKTNNTYNNTNNNTSFLPSRKAQLIALFDPNERMNEMYELFSGDQIEAMLTSSAFGENSPNNAHNKTTEILRAIQSVYEEEGNYVQYGRKKIRTDVLQNALDSLEPIQIATVAYEMQNVRNEVHDLYAYMITSLYRASFTTGSFYNDMKTKFQIDPMSD